MAGEPVKAPEFYKEEAIKRAKALAEIMDAATAAGMKLDIVIKNENGKTTTTVSAWQKV